MEEGMREESEVSIIASLSTRRQRLVATANGRAEGVCPQEKEAVLTPEMEDPREEDTEIAHTVTEEEIEVTAIEAVIEDMVATEVATEATAVTEEGTATEEETEATAVTEGATATEAAIEATAIVEDLEIGKEKEEATTDLLVMTASQPKVARNWS